MNETILGVLKKKTVILATHALQFLKNSNYIYLLEEGVIKKEGNFENISKSELYRKFEEIEKWTNSKISDKDQEVERLRLSEETIEENIGLSKVISRKISQSFIEEDIVDLNNPLILELNLAEDREIGSVSFKVLRIFLKEIGGFRTILIPFTLHTIRQILLVISLNYLQEWSYRYDPSNKMDDYKEYGIYQLSGCFLESISRIFFIWIGYSLSLKLHNKMVYRVIHAKIEDFLERIPSGRLMNRFSKDVSQVDQNLTEEMSYMMYLISRVLVTIGTIGFALGYQITFLVIIMIIISIIYQQRYQNARREYKRLESISRSPVLNISSDTLKGLPSIRTMNLIQFMRLKFEHSINENAKNQLTCYILRNWFDFRLGLTSLLFIHLPCYLLMLFYFKDLTVSKVGLFLVSVFTLVETMENLINQISEVEISMIAIERCQAFQEVDVEEQYYDYEAEYNDIIAKGGSKPEKYIAIHENKKRSKYIITKGEIKFKDFSAKYKTSHKKVLKNLNLIIQPGQKIGIVGRTGSGKSSLIRALWRSLDGSNGKIEIDGKNIASLELKTLRSQMTIVTQDVALFEGTLRDNIDPCVKREIKDEDLSKILEELEFNHRQYTAKGLDMKIDTNGGNLSEGEKQLICFARCLINFSKVIILDEATACIDLKTEENIQKAMKEYFSDSTVLIIAHRVQTIMECDKILILKDGEIDGFDRPRYLLDSNMFFKEIVEKMRSKEKEKKNN